MPPDIQKCQLARPQHERHGRVDSLAHERQVPTCLQPRATHGDRPMDSSMPIDHSSGLDSTGDTHVLTTLINTFMPLYQGFTAVVLISIHDQHPH